MATNLGDLLRAKGLSASATANDEPETTPADAPSTKSPYGPKVVVRATRKGRGGKTVTEVQGVVHDRESIAKKLKKTLGVGARVEDELIVVQGDQCERIASWLGKQGVKKVVRG
jgi:translation initiation factor 1